MQRPSPYGYVAPFLRQAKAVAWDRLQQIVEPLRRRGLVTLSQMDLAVRWTTGASIRLWGADNADALRGLGLAGLVLDETAQVDGSVWEDVLQPALSDRQGWLLAIGTPSGVDLLHELWSRGERGEPGWTSKRYTVHDTGALDPDEVARLERTMAPLSWRREYLCDFSAQGEAQLLSIDEATAASRREVLPEDLNGAPRVIGVDVARQGRDATAIVRRYGRLVLPITVLQGADNMAVASILANMVQDWRPHGVFIDQGAGAGVIDRMRQLGHDVVEVPFGGTALRRGVFVDRRTEMWSLMADWVKSIGAIPRDADLIRELATPRVDYRPDGRMVMESKDNIRSRLPMRASPDMGDALALTFAAPVLVTDDPAEVLGAARIPGIVHQHREPQAFDYDPYA